MTSEEKNRLILLLAFAETDETYGKLLQQTAEVDDLYVKLLRELPKEEADNLQKVVTAYMKLARNTAEFACRYMIFPGEQT